MLNIQGIIKRKDIPKEVREVIRKEIARHNEIEDSLRKHIQMIDFADDTIMIRDLKDKIIYWNQGAERLYGWTREESIGQYVHTFLRTVFPVPLEKAIQTCLKTGYWEGELRHAKKDGSFVTVASRWTLQKNSKGRPIAYLEINNDITELKKTEAELRDARDELERRVEKRTAELKKANRELQMLIHERRRLEREILEISGMEQRRIGQDLHDGLSQHLTGIAFMGKVLEQQLTAQGAPEAVHVKKIVELVNQSISQTRSLARGLYPVELELHGLMSSLQELASHTKNLFYIPCEFRYNQPISIRDYETANHLYRIAQEAVNNALKHGKPKHIWIRLHVENDKLIMQIQDDGLGIQSSDRRVKGMGLRIMRYRAEMMDAHLEILGNPGEGTLLTCTIPSFKQHRKKKSRA